VAKDLNNRVFLIIMQYYISHPDDVSESGSETVHNMVLLEVPDEISVFVPISNKVSVCVPISNEVSVDVSISNEVSVGFSLSGEDSGGYHISGEASIKIVSNNYISNEELIRIFRNNLDDIKNKINLTNRLYNFKKIQYEFSKRENVLIKKEYNTTENDILERLLYFNQLTNHQTSKESINNKSTFLKNNMFMENAKIKLFNARKNLGRLPKDFNKWCGSMDSYLIGLQSNNISFLYSLKCHMLEILINNLDDNDSNAIWNALIFDQQLYPNDTNRSLNYIIYSLNNSNKMDPIYYARKIVIKVYGGRLPKYIKDWPDEYWAFLFALQETENNSKFKNYMREHIINEFWMNKTSNRSYAIWKALKIDSKYHNSDNSRLSGEFVYRNYRD